MDFLQRLLKLNFRCSIAASETTSPGATLYLSLRKDNISLRVLYFLPIMKPLPYLLTEPPDALKKARLDNIALVPASLLTLKTAYTELANTLPKGSILCVQTASPRHKRI